MNSSQPTSAPTLLNANISTVQATCDKHGSYEARQLAPVFEGAKIIITPCPACGAEASARADARDRQRIENDRRDKIARLLNRAFIPERFADRTLENYRAETPGQQRALKIAKRYSEAFGEKANRGASLVLAGKPGTGKTHIACGIARELIEQKLLSAVFLTVLQALRHIKSTYRKDSEKSESDAIDDLLQPDLLILDEVGAQLGSEHEKMLMFEIINERYQECRATILISNLNADELGEFLGDRVIDRFRESGAVVAFDWESHRGKREVA